MARPAVSEPKPTSAMPPMNENKRPKPNMEYLRDKDRETVKGVFHFYEVPGGVLEFSLLLHKGDKLTNYKLRDGEICSIPLGVAKHLNRSGRYPVHTHAVDKDGNPTLRVGQKVARYSFQSLEFVDVDDFGIDAGKEIITVERAMPDHIVS